MIPLKQLIGSMIDSYLGPHKSNKFVTEDKQVQMVKCPLQLLQQMNLKDHMSYLVEDSLSLHHEQYGCSVTTLLAMWYLWYEEFQLLLQEGVPAGNIIEHCQDILDIVISDLPKVTKDLKQEVSLYCARTASDTQTEHNYKLSPLLPKSSSSSNSLPPGIRYKSRHFSPNQENSFDDVISKLLDSSPENILYSSEMLKNALQSMLIPLSHGDLESAEMVCELWMKQVRFSRSLKFNTDGIIVCPVSLPYSYSEVVDGLIIKRNSIFMDQDFSISATQKTLMIKGSVTFEYVHLGHSAEAQIEVQKTPDDLLESDKDKWTKKCCELLTELQVNVILVHGEVDAGVASFCAAHSILVCEGIPWSILKVLITAEDTYSCTYLLDCDSQNVNTGLKVRKWSIGGRTYQHIDEYFKIEKINLLKKANFSTVVLCHPSPSHLECLQHQFWHLTHRLSLATDGNSLLPGGGLTEKWCYEKLKTSASDVKSRVQSSILNGLHDYFRIVSSKKALINETDEDVKILDELRSKTEAWKTAMELAVLMLQCDTLILNGDHGGTVKHLESEGKLIGFL